MSEHKQGAKSRALLRTCWGFSVVLTLAPTSGRSFHSLIRRDWIQNCCRRGCHKHSAVAERSVAKHRRAMTGEIYHMWVDLPGEINSPTVVMSGKVWRIAALFLYLVGVLFCWGGGRVGRVAGWIYIRVTSFRKTQISENSVLPLSSCSRY